VVKLLSLDVRNFKKLRFDSSIDFSDGITLIAGLNESGKSSMLDAILYALFGRVIRPLKAKNEDLISYGATEATITLECEIADRRFRVTRHLYKSKPTRATLDEITAKGAVLPVAAGQEKVNDEVVNLLGGITYPEIISSTVVAQKELDKLIELNRDDRRKVINAFLNLDSFNTVTAALSEERKDLEGTGSRIGKVHVEREKLLLLRQELDQYRRNAEEKSALEKQNMTLAEELRTSQIKFQEQNSLCSTLSRYEAAARAKENLSLQLTSKRQICADHLARSERLHKEIASIQAELDSYADYEKTQPSLERIKMQLEKAKALSIELSTTERSWQATQKEVGTLQSALASEGDARVRTQAGQVGKPILPFVVSSALLLLGGFAAYIVGVLPIAVALIAFGFVALVLVVLRVNATTSLLRHQSMLGDLRYLDQKRQDLLVAEQRHLQAERDLRTAEEELASLCNSIPEFVEAFRASRKMGTMQAGQILLDVAQKSREGKNALQVKLATVRAEMQKLPPENELVKVQKQIETLDREFNQLTLPELPICVSFTPEVLSDALGGRDEIGRKIAAAQSRIEQNSQRIDSLDKYLTENAGIVPKVQSQEELVKRLERQLKVIRRAIEGIQSTAESLRTRIRPSVQSHMASILPALTSSRYRAAILDENYGLQVWDPDAGEYKPRDVYSGGTEDQFLLAMRLAFALALLPEVKGHKPEFVFLDEPLASSDDVRRSGIVEYLASDLSKKFKQIFIISHVGGLEDHVQNTITLDEGKVV